MYLLNQAYNRDSNNKKIVDVDEEGLERNEKKNR